MKGGTFMLPLWISLILVFSIPSIYFTPDEASKIVITQSDEDSIKKLLNEYNEEWRKYTEKHMSSSHIPSYLDCESYRSLLKYDLKVIPYLVEAMALTEAHYSDWGWIGSAIIADKDVKTPEEVYEYNRNPKKESHKTSEIYPFPFSLMPPYRPTLLMQLLPDDMKPKPDVKKGYVDNGKYAWSHWWQNYKNRFIFKTKKPLVIMPAEIVPSTMPHISTTVKNGLLYIEAVSATYQQIIERAAAEMNVNVFIGEQEYIDVITTVRMKGVTFEEFLYIVGRTVYTAGFNYHKTETGYQVGSDRPAQPRMILDGWGIMMGRTVFNVGDKIPVSIIARKPKNTYDPNYIVDPNDPAFSSWGSFRITDNEGKIIKDYDFITKVQPTKETIQIQKDIFPFVVFLDKFCTLPKGEYNVRFKYLENETPSIAIEIYDRKVDRQ